MTQMTAREANPIPGLQTGQFDLSIFTVAFQKLNLTKRKHFLKSDTEITSSLANHIVASH